MRTRRLSFRAASTAMRGRFATGTAVGSPTGAFWSPDVEARAVLGADSLEDLAGQLAAQAAAEARFGRRAIPRSGHRGAGVRETAR